MRKDPTDGLEKLFYVVVALVILCFIGALGFAGSAHAATVNFAWTANAEPDLAGYRLFHRNAGENYDYATPVAEIPAGTEVCTVEGVPDGDHRWVLRAFDLAGNESGDSNECDLVFDFPPGPVQGFG